MDLGLSSLEALINTDQFVDANELIAELDDYLLESQHDINETNDRLVAINNLREIKAQIEAGNSAAVEALLGKEWTAAECDATINQLMASNDDTGMEVIAATAVIASGVIALITKETIDHILQSNKTLYSKFYKYDAKFETGTIDDSSVQDAHAQTLPSYDEFIRRVALLNEIQAIFQKTTVSGKDVVKDAKRLVQVGRELGWKHVGKFLWLFTTAETGTAEPTFRKAMKELFTFRGQRAGDIGWNGANLKKSIPVIKKLMDARPSEIMVQADEAKFVENAYRSAAKTKELNVLYSTCLRVYYHEVGLLARGIIKLMKKAQPNIDL